MAYEGLITTRGDFLEYCEHCRIPREGRAFIDRARTGDPSRTVQGGLFNVVADYTSEKMGFVVGCESHTVELCFAHRYEYSKRVREYHPQPGSLTCHEPGTKGKRDRFSTTPDFLVLDVDQALLVETKTEKELLALSKKYPKCYQKRDGKWVCPPAIAAAAKLGMIYEIHSSNEISVNFSRWAEFVRPFFAYRVEVASDKIQAACDYAERHPIVTLAEMRAALSERLSKDDLNALIAYRRLHVDWEAAPPTEPDNVFVFADRDALQAFSASRASHPIHDFAVEIRAGNWIDFYGEPRQILNAGEEMISLDQGVDVPRERFEFLVKTGSIGSIPDPDGEAPMDEEKGIFSTADHKEVQRAAKIVEQIQDHLDGKPVPGKSKRTLRDHVSKFTEGLRRGLSGLAAVMRKKPSGNPHPKGSLDEESRARLNKHIEDNYERPNASNKWNCFAGYEKECKEENQKRLRKKKKLLMIASYETYRLTIINRRGEAQMRKRFGERAANQKRPWFCWFLTLGMRPHGDRPFEIAHIDHTLIDLQMLGKQSRKRKHKKRGDKRLQNYGRLWWTTMVDAHTREILAQYLTFDPPSYRSCMMVFRECVRRLGRLPQTIVVDNGPEFRGWYFRFLAAAFKITIKRRPKGRPRHGSVQERPFGTANKQFFHELLGNTKLSKQVRLVVKSHDPLMLAIWDLEALIPVLDKWSYQIYPKQSQSGLRMSPREALKQGLKKHGYFNNSRIVYGPEFIYLTAPTTRKGTAKVIENGPYVVINYLKYFSPLLNNPKVMGKQVEVRYDPFDLGHAWVYIGQHWVECRSELYADFHGKSEKLISMAARRIHAENRAHPLRRRTVNGPVLAEFLAAVHQQEEYLIQQLRDDESRKLRLRISSPGVSKPAVAPKESNAVDNPKPPQMRKPVKSARPVTESCVAV
jgi:putative transposase